MKKETISERFSNSEFGLEYIKILAPITSKHVKEYLDIIKNGNKEKIDYDEIGTDAELELKKVMKYYGQLSTIFEDLEKVLIFLKVDDRKKIEETYPELENHKSYYIYHFENYIIRLISIPDLLGKLGNILYQTNIKEKKCNGYNFKEAIKEEFEDKAKIVKKLLVRMEEIKSLRHQKLHTGETDIPYLNGIVFYNDLLKITGKKDEGSEILEAYTDQNLEEQVDKIEEEIKEIIDIINHFLNESIGCLKQLAE